MKLLKWRLISQTGWTIEYVDSLSLGKFRELIQLEDGDTKAQMIKMKKTPRGKK